MTYFQNIHSLAELKKQYRTLALDNHPDKGGSTEIMQQINAEFTRLYAVWKDDTTVSATASGYESDYAGATAEEYADYVYNEYRWTGSNYKGQHAPEVVELVRNWLKETYPRYKFSVRRENYNSIYITLMQADFEAFTRESGVRTYADVNHYRIERETTLTQKARDVMRNVCAFVMSYNFDDSDPMTDYFHTNFYLNMSVGTYKKPYRTSLPKLTCRKGDEQPVFKYPEGAAHKAIRQALDGARFGFVDSRRASGRMVLGTDSFHHDGKTSFWPKQYSSAKTAQKRMDRLAAAGIRSRLTGYNGGFIEFLGYTDQTRETLENEREEYITAYQKWQAAQHTTNVSIKPSAEPNKVRAMPRRENEE
ncbi:LPD29 domain-containing protein [uncultured Alistipes sp.]|uniref:LPD29 domain-containing protein n=1 Tax=uncultured Alistipes sp. TaxID=538949 RepID=UPI00260776A9|nr:LPD29 domain-containing protein [uncultured Alistipes sp.]